MRNRNAGWKLGAAALSVLAALAGARATQAVAPKEALVRPERLDKISGAYLGTPYFLDALGEESGPDKDPLFTRKCVDCQTLVEQVMAEAIAPAVGGQDQAVKVIRYHGSKVSLENRYHYCIPDWLKNPWPAKDITREVAGKAVVTSERRIDLPKFLAGRGADAKRSPVSGVQVVNAAYVPMDRITELPAAKLDGTIAIWVMNKPDIVAAHCGFLFNRDGQAILRHASQKQKKVIDQTLPEFASTASKRIIGLMILKPTMAGLQRRS